MTLLLYRDNSIGEGKICGVRQDITLSGLLLSIKLKPMIFYRIWTCIFGLLEQRTSLFTIATLICLIDTFVCHFCFIYVAVLLQSLLLISVFCHIAYLCNASVLRKILPKQSNLFVNMDIYLSIYIWIFQVLCIFLRHTLIIRDND